jgi:phage terminase large subunit-like protein
LRLVHCAVWRPDGGEVDLDAVEREIVAVHQRFGLASLLADKWQAVGMLQRLQKRGVRAEGVDFSGGTLREMASEVLRVFRDGTLDLYPDGDLLADLRGLRLVEKSYGTRLESPRSKSGGHGDTATALALALLGCKRLRQAGPPVIRRKLVYQ